MPIIFVYIGAVVGIIGAIYGGITLILKLEERSKARKKEEADRQQALAAEEAARQLAAAGTLNIALNFYHDMGATVFVKVTVDSSRTSDDRITGVELMSPGITQVKVLVPAQAPTVPITPQAWQQWNQSFPLVVPAGGVLIFWVSGYAQLGIIEHRREGVVGNQFDFKVYTARSGEKVVRVPLEVRNW